MDLKTIREELSRLESLVGGWQAAAEVPAVERDLALELLRRLYEQLRFDAPGAPQPEEAGTGAVEVPESIDLDEMLALEPVAAAAVEESAVAADDDNEAEAVMKAEEAAAPAPGSPEARAAAAEEAAAETVEVVTATVDEERTDAAGKNVPETPAAEAAAPEEPAAEEVKETVETSPAVPVSEPVAQTAPAESAESAQPAVEAAAAEPDVAVEPAVEPAVVAEPVVAAEPAAAPAVGSEAGEEEHHAGGRPRAVMGSLFGAEEPVVRHRHRQRVIMSLYGDAEPASGERLSGTGTVRKPAASVAERRMAGLRDEAAGEEARAVSPTASQPAPAAAAAEHSVEAAAVKGEAAGQRPETEPSAGPQTAPQNDVENAPQTEQQTESEVQSEVAVPELQSEAAAEAVASDPGAGEEEVDPFVEVELAPDAIAEEAAPAPEQPEEPEAEPEPESESEPEPEPVQSHPAHASHSAGAVPHGAGPGAAPHAHPSAPLAAEGGAVLGEVINHDVRTLADTIAPPRDMASQIARSEPVTDLRRAIGINDRFLMIRDLFGGDADAYERAITALDGCSDLDECMIYIAENYAWNSSSDGARFLMELLERKYA